MYNAPQLVRLILRAIRSGKRVWFRLSGSTGLDSDKGVAELVADARWLSESRAQVYCDDSTWYNIVDQSQVFVESALVESQSALSPREQVLDLFPLATCEPIVGASHTRPKFGVFLVGNGVIAEAFDREVAWKLALTRITTIRDAGANVYRQVDDFVANAILATRKAS